MTRNTADNELNVVEDWLDNLDPATDPAKDGRNMRRISAALESVQAAERGLVDAVRQAREAGDSWAMIGTALGTSRQAAYQRFGGGGSADLQQATKRTAKKSQPKTAARRAAAQAHRKIARDK